MRHALAFVLVVAGCAAGSDGSDGVGSRFEREVVIDPAFLDLDQDGLCDGTEDELGTDPLAADSDEDGLPDLIELASSFDATDPGIPAAEQVAYLEGRRGARLDFEIRATVHGDGQSLSGAFSAAGSFYRDGKTAADFFAGSMALSADPVDAARSIMEESARFTSVLGRTRLAFNLEFDYGDRGDSECGHTYPFRYAIKAEDGSTRTERLYLLVIGTPGATSLREDTPCLPMTCE